MFEKTEWGDMTSVLCLIEAAALGPPPQQWNLEKFVQFTQNKNTFLKALSRKNHFVQKN